MRAGSGGEDQATVAQIDAFDEIVDVRSPSEYAEDHLPGAVNCPVLDDAERARVGTLYVQACAFQAKKLGAALVARNIARHIEERFAARERGWRALVYCWRGGERSGAMAHVLRRVGWPVAVLKGGYRAYRREVLAQLEALPERLDFRVICGATGSGKSRLLEALERRGAQVLDLEDIARHRGSVLGELPGDPQPSQKRFDSLVWQRLRRFDRARPVFAEAESRRIGACQIGSALIERLRDAPCVVIEAPAPERVRFLKEEYRHFFGDVGRLEARLECLSAVHGHATVSRWTAMARAGDWDALVADLLDTHYDPSYRRSTRRNFARYDGARTLALDRLDPESLGQAAGELLATT